MNCPKCGSDRVYGRRCLACGLLLESPIIRESAPPLRDATLGRPQGSPIPLAETERAPRDLFAAATPAAAPEDLFLLELPPEDPPAEPEMPESYESGRADGGFRADRKKTRPLTTPPAAPTLCPACQAPVSGAFCDACGARMPRMSKKAPDDEPKRCRQCGYTKNKASMQNCGNCGSILR